MNTVITTEGALDVDVLARTLGFEDRPEQYVIWIEWRLEGALVRRDTFPVLKTCGDPVVTSHGELPASSLARTIELCDRDEEIVVVELFRLGDEVVKRSPHVILKKASVAAEAIAGGLG